MFMLNAVYFYRFSNWLYTHHIPVFPKLITLLIFLIYNSKIPYKATIGKSTKFGYGGIGVVIHDRVVIADNCRIGQNVTIGGTSGHYEVPIIGNNVRISVGAVVIGPIKIGNNVIIGANAVVNRDVPDNCIVAGVPAKIIKYINEDEFNRYGLL